jgi:putative Mg2+ transporter-C (MgtC) family protein
VFVLAGNTLLRPLVNWVNRRPMKESQVEAVYRVHVTADPANVAIARDRLYEVLEAANYPIRDIETLSDTEDQVELAAVLVPTEANPAELDAATALLEKTAGITSATWTSGATA